MKRPASKIVRLWVCPADLAEWKSQAGKHGLSLSEYIRRRVNLRPLTARKPKGSAKQSEPDGVLHMSPGELAELNELEVDPEYEERCARIKADLERRSQAKELAQSAGGVERWFAGMSSKECAQWDDLQESLPKSEREEHEL
jgi:hypothetical protein